MMLLELEQRSVVSAASFVTRDAPEREHDPQRKVLVQIARRGGGEVPAKHAAVVALAATIVAAKDHSAAGQEASARRRNSASWVQQGRTLLHASHNVAHRAIPSRPAR